MLKYLTIAAAIFVAAFPLRTAGGDLQSSFLSTDTAGGFQGVMLGIFAHN
jgi:hypothetical protein